MFGLQERSLTYQWIIKYTLLESKTSIESEDLYTGKYQDIAMVLYI